MQSHIFRDCVYRALLKCISILLCAITASACAADNQSKNARISIKTLDQGDRHVIDIDCRAPEPGGVLVVGIIEPLDPELAHTHTDLAADGADLWNAAVVLAARAPTEGVVRLELDIQETRRLFGNDVRLVSVITSQATLLIYADKSVKGAGARTTRIVRSADLSESLQSFGQIYSTAPDADSLGFVSADGFCRVIIEDQHSIARMAIHLK